METFNEVQVKFEDAVDFENLKTFHIKKQIAKEVSKEEIQDIIKTLDANHDAAKRANEMAKKYLGIVDYVSNLSCPDADKWEMLPNGNEAFYEKLTYEKTGLGFAYDVQQVKHIERVKLAAQKRI